eukprot:CAMPEP_0114976930 /NCGR_PEP_ID=MMETSP0216-20121206/2948_1 /TAXON_ID=223996 /ORGANISM="Protocruzia adherens, Strain Boccale" /LENGTH=193 /DNA_ID=CAMNT_0002337917 /DNA_START=96 /DNA_END=677 /DNA_ORIENTATION=+
MSNFFSTVLLATLLTVSCLAAGDTTPGCVTLYDECNHTGYYVKSCSENVKMDKVSLGSAVSSFELGGGDYAYIFCRPTNFCTWAPRVDSTCLGGWNHLLTYVRPIPIGPNCVILYDGASWTGTTYTACGDVSDLVAAGFDNKATSFLLGSNVDSVTFYGHLHYTGDTLVKSDNLYNMGSFNNILSSLKITLKS